jgi:MFS family permease
MFKGREQYIGLVLLVLALAGAGASMLIERMPAANPSRLFPRNLIKPLFDNLRTMLASRPLALSILGIAFFTFMVAFMRAAMYMHGETRDPRWDEFRTSWVVATVALGVGLGSPLAGFLSGGKVELGLVPLGAVGMIAALLAAAVAVFNLEPLIVALICIGFFSGFYIVPLYTLLQHRAPKTSKGDLIATSNFINVTGAIAASLLFYLLVFAAHKSGITPEVAQREYLRGVLASDPTFRNGRPVAVEILRSDDHTRQPLVVGRVEEPEAEGDDPGQIEEPIELDEGLLELVGGGLKAGDEVIVTTFMMRGRDHYKVRPADQAETAVFDDAMLPRFLFVGAACMTMGILVLLCRQLPDFFARSLLWLRSWGRYRLRVVGSNHLPGSGAVILATNCGSAESCLQVLSATDRSTRFLFLEDPAEARSPLVRYLAWRSSLAVVKPAGATRQQWDHALNEAVQVLDKGEVVGLPSGINGELGVVDEFLGRLEKRHRAAIIPVFCGCPEGASGRRRVRVVIGQAMPPEAPPDLVRREIERLGKGEGDHGGATSVATTVRIPAVSSASPTGPAATRPANPLPE